jgi:hypothetical protein
MMAAKRQAVRHERLASDQPGFFCALKPIKGVAMADVHELVWRNGNPN